MSVEALQPQTLAASESSGAGYYAETNSPIAPDDQSAFFTMIGVMDGYADRVRIGEAAMPASVHSLGELDAILALTEHQRRHANYLRHGSCDEDDEALYAMSIRGAFERLVEPKLLHVSWGATRPMPITSPQLDVLQRAIADRAQFADSEAEIAGLRYLCQTLGFEQTFISSLPENPVSERLAQLALSQETRYDLPVAAARIIPFPRRKRRGKGVMPVGAAVASFTLAVSQGLHKQSMSR